MKKEKSIIEFFVGAGTGIIVSCLLSPDSIRRTAAIIIGLIMIGIGWYKKQGMIIKFLDIWKNSMKNEKKQDNGDETQCPVSKSGLLYFKVKFLRSLKAQNPVFSETIILHLSVQPDLLRRYGLLQHAVRHIQKSCHRRCDRYRDIFWQFR